MRVTDIALSAKVSGSKVSVTGDVFVKDSSGQAVPNAAVAIRWTLPGGASRTATATTGATGRARFTTSGARGTYTLTITGVTKSGYVFDPAGSVMSRSITR
jgi:hypothetical protein